jgi:Flp pilus assembly protein TadG
VVRLRRSRRHSERGAVAVLVALLSVCLFTVAALVVDVGTPAT